MTGRERGSGTIMLLAIVLVMLLITGAVGLRTGGDGCAAAAALAAKNHHRVDDCNTVGDRLDFVLTIQVVAPVAASIPPLPEEVTATAHAGPVR